jgi:hypothetical protein
MKGYKIIYLIVLFLLTVGCEMETSWDLQHDNQDKLIVDGILTNEFKVQQIKLSHSIQNLNESARPFTGADIVVTDSNRVFIFTESSEKPGTYLSERFRAVVGRKYYLIIQTDSLKYEAVAKAVAVTPLKVISLEKENDTNLYTYSHIEDLKPSMVEVYYDWSSDPAYCSSYGFCQAAETYYSLNNVDVNKAFSPEKLKIKFPAGTKIVRKKYSLSEEHQEFLRSLLIETEWRGGIFDVQQGNVKTNLTNGALGFFAVCMVVSDSIVVE